MVSFLPLPEWVPTWVHAVILCAGALLTLSFMLLPFAVFGTKTRLEAIEARLDEIQGEIRSLALRLPEPLPAEEEVNSYAAQPVSRPPIPPAPRSPVDRASNLAPLPAARRSAARTEPRLY